MTFDISAIGPMMEAGYIAAAYYLRRLRPDLPTTVEFLQALVRGEVRLTWEQVFPPPHSRRLLCHQPAGRVREEAVRFVAAPYPALFPEAALETISLDEELRRRNCEQREAAPDELGDLPFCDIPLAIAQCRIVRWDVFANRSLACG